MLACAGPIVVILAGMEITGLGWCGTRTGRSSELAHFYEHVLGLRLVHTDEGFWVFELPDGRHAEIFGSSYPGKDINISHIILSVLKPNPAIFRAQ